MTGPHPICCVGGAAILLALNATAQSGWQRRHELIPIWTDEPLATSSTGGEWCEALWLDPFRDRSLLLTSAATPAQPGLVRWYSARAGIWRESPAPVPQGGLLVPLANDTQRRVLVAILRKPAGVETWEHDGVDWQQKSSSGALPGWPYLAAAYDTHRARTVLFVSDPRLPRTLEWDGASWQQRLPRQVPTAGLLPRMAYDPLRRRSVLFSSTTGTPQAHSELWEWDGTDWSQRAATTPLGDRQSPAIGWDPSRGQVLLHGGAKYSQAPSGPMPDTWAWNGSSWQLVTLQGPPLDRPEMMFDKARGGMRMVGRGWSGAPTTPLEEWLLGPTGWTLVSGSQGLQWPLGGAQLCTESGSGGRPLQFAAGLAGSTYVTRMRAWDGEWDDLQPSSTPPARYLAALGPAPAGDRMLLFGGIDPLAMKELGDTWIWDGTTWHSRTVSGPPARAGAAMAHDTSRGVTLLFGGWSSGPLSDTWSWNGSSWTHHAVPGPSARGYHTMAYDPQRRRTVLFGGLTLQGTSNETWVWDGTQWALQSASVAPAPRIGAAMAADPRSGLIVLFGGSDQVGSLGDGWTWDGARWIPMPPSGLPPARHWHGLAWDPRSQRLVLHGGQHTDRNGNPGLYGSFGDTWVFGATVPSRATGYGLGCGGASPPVLGAFGHPVLGDAGFGLEVTRIRAGAPLLLLISLLKVDLPIGGNCRVLVDPNALLLQLPGLADASGQSFQQLRVPADPAFTGASVFAQSFGFDLSGPLPMLLATAGLQLTLGD